MSAIRIDTPRLIIRTPVLEDAPALNAAIHASAAELRPWMPWAQQLPTPAETAANLTEAIAQTEADRDYRLLLFTRDGVLVGSSGLHGIDWRQPSGEIGYWVDTRHAGRGYASEATTAIAGYAREVMGLRRIQIVVSDTNSRSWRIAERCGFALEGVLREHRINPDGNRDHTRIYALTAGDAVGSGRWAQLHQQARAPRPMAPQAPPLLRFDPSSDVALDPQRILQRHPEMPAACVLCFFQDAIAARVAIDGGALVRHLRSEIGEIPVHRLGDGAQAVALVHPGVGAPLAAGLLEELIALGAKRFIVCGGAGALRDDLACGHLVVPDRALRDEGTSYHYLPPGRTVEPGSHALTVLQRTLREANAPYSVGATWTTDAIYRETRPRITQRQAEGCLTVEMEAAALFAVARHRNVELACLLYCGDMVAGECWDGRDWHRRGDVRGKMLDLALCAARHAAWSEGNP
jgi:uridine phosphorylase